MPSIPVLPFPDQMPMAGGGFAGFLQGLAGANIPGIIIDKKKLKQEKEAEKERAATEQTRYEAQQARYEKEAARADAWRQYKMDLEAQKEKAKIEVDEKKKKAEMAVADFNSSLPATVSPQQYQKSFRKYHDDLAKVDPELAGEVKTSLYGGKWKPKEPQVQQAAKPPSTSTYERAQTNLNKAIADFSAADIQINENAKLGTSPQLWNPQDKNGILQGFGDIVINTQQSLREAKKLGNDTLAKEADRVTPVLKRAATNVFNVLAGQDFENVAAIRGTMNEDQIKGNPVFTRIKKQFMDSYPYVDEPDADMMLYNYFGVKTK